MSNLMRTANQNKEINKQPTSKTNQNIINTKIHTTRKTNEFSNELETQKTNFIVTAKSWPPWSSR